MSPSRVRAWHILLLALVLRAALHPWIGIPHPIIHDEFSYLLAADTYAHGHLANPPHAMWQHFETFQEIQQPVYASKYQPLQGLTLAFGQRFLQQPWVGVYLSTALMCAATLWMLQGWVPQAWAILGSLLFVLRVGVLSYWMNSYEGGSVPAIGGALAFGALPRIWCERRLTQGAVWALGIVILVLSRPYDAVAVGLASAALLLWKLPRPEWLRIAAPAAPVLALGLAAVVYTDLRITGHPFTLPYQLHDAQYAVAPVFATFPLHPEPAYRHAVIREFWTGPNRTMWQETRSEPLVQFAGKLYTLSDFFLGFELLTVPLLLWPFARPTFEEKAAAFLLAALALMVAPLINVYPHYGAAFAGVVYARLAQSLSRVWNWRAAGKPVGRAVVIATVALSGCAFLNSALGQMRNGRELLWFPAGRDTVSRRLAQRGSDFGRTRDRVAQELARAPGEHLVLVRYSPEHNIQNEWVFNGADIDSSRIVWARSMSPQADAEIVRYFAGRSAWVLNADDPDPEPQPYPGISVTASNTPR